MAEKLIAIVGITGNQGGGVADVFLNEPGWKIRGITRDIRKPSAKEWSDKGVETAAADLDDAESLKKAFRGANVIFGVTDFWQFMKNPATHERAAKEGRTSNEVAYDLEVQQGRNIVDAAAATVDSLDRFVLSTLNDATKWSKGAIKFNLHFDAKWRAVEYLREKYPELAKKTSYVQMGFFATNMKSPQGGAPQKQEDGTYKVTMPMSGDVKFPIGDPRRDMGYYVKASFQAPAGTNLMGCGSVITWTEFCEIWGKTLGKTVVFQESDPKFLEEMIPGGTGKELADMFRYIGQFGYDGGDPDVVYPWNLGFDVKYTTIEEFVKQEDWSSVL